MMMFKRNETRRRLFAVALFLGVSTTTAQSTASQIEYLQSDDSPVIEMRFFDNGEFTSVYNFNRSIIDASALSATYWKNILNLRGLQTPWQIALTTDALPIIDGKTFSFDNSIPIQDNYLAQMLQGKRDLVPFNLQALTGEKITTQDVQAFLQRHSPIDGSSAVSIVTIGNNLGANREGAINGWSIDENTILPTNEQAADLVGTMRLELAKTLGANIDDFSYRNYTTLTERELASMQDLGFDFDIKKFYGRSIYSSGKTLTNKNDFTSADPLAVGLHVWGANNNVTQSGNIALTGNGAAGICVNGSNNQITIPHSTNIQSEGLRGKGILISYGREHTLTIGGNITAAGNAVEFNFGSNMLGASGEYRGSYIRYLRGVDANGNIISAENLPITMSNGFNYSADELNGALVNDFNLSGNLTGGEHAIYIGKNSFVRNININSGASINGNIVSDWKHFTEADGFFPAYPIKIQYGGNSYDAANYIPDLVTNLNFNTSLDYGGNISGADNIKMHINAGTLKFSGAADVLSVDVMQGAKLYGGTFNLHDMNDGATGKFINHGTIAAGTPYTNLVINGDLISDGVIQKVSGGSAGSIIVNGNANVEGSIVSTDSLLPNETETVLIANSITGNIKNPIGNPVPVSGMLEATGEIVGNTLTVTTYEANHTDNLEPQEKETFDAMSHMFDKLEGKDKQEEMRELYNLAPNDTKKTLTQIGSNDSAQVMSVVQQNTVIDNMISDRVARIFAPNYINVNVRSMNFAEDDTDAAPDMTIRVKVPLRQENNLWLNYMKNWGSLREGTDYHGSVIVGGYDRPIGKKVRAGIFATYGTIGYGADASRATVYDTRLGLYAGYHNRASDVYFYVNGGQLRNSLHRGIPSLGLSTNANYKSHIVEVGGEYKYDLTPNKSWHVSPFVNFQASYLRQDSYNERGAGIYNQHVDANSNNYFAAQIGLDLKRYYQSGMFGMKFGIKHGFTGADPDLRISYEGDSEHSYLLRQKRDKTHFLFSVRGENEFAYGWSVGGEAELQLGENDKDVTASLTLRRIW